MFPLVRLLTGLPSPVMPDKAPHDHEVDTDLTELYVDVWVRLREELGRVPTSDEVQDEIQAAKAGGLL